MERDALSRYSLLISSGDAPARRGPRGRRGRQPGGVRILWENPRGPSGGVIIERRRRAMVYSRRVGPRGYLTMAEAAEVLGTYRMQVYRLAWSGELKTKTVSGMRVVMLGEVKRILGQL